MQFIDYYAVLGVSKDASIKEIRKCYIELIRRYHPDVCSDKDANKKAALINQAYAMLSDVEMRKAYDLEYDKRVKVNLSSRRESKTVRHSNSYCESDLLKKVKKQIMECLELYNVCMTKKQALISDLVNYSANPTECAVKFMEWLTIANKCKNNLEKLCRLVQSYGLDSSGLQARAYVLSKAIIEVKVVYDLEKELIKGLERKAGNSYSWIKENKSYKYSNKIYS